MRHAIIVDLREDLIQEAWEAFDHAGFETLGNPFYFRWRMDHEYYDEAHKNAAIIINDCLRVLGLSEKDMIFLSDGW